MKLLALSGSLRAASHNTALLRACALLAPAGMQLTLYPTLGLLPLFNPDLEAIPPEPVADLRAQIIAADALLIASPEYAHGVSGVMKNALDWMVSSEAFVDKPVALLNASPRATHAQAALREILCTMSARLIEDASLAVPILGSKLDIQGICAHPAISSSLLGALTALQMHPVSLSA
ncbi:NADPH-dependent FMN reductase [Jeongeupia naejangsanensis]|uniref:NAD(P)H-dependent oxidoreductase n=1 Tax=Jeongeupia naejangsanensis TaxID=613195 RepID=A0ABS2BIB9_9NEIS|nr:NADPH-dependent FMN reductase [Jeongeupia naejangsanensis]MBM3115180.1 NAD(P)H-dependent oxidoreductase [Jeongeupia naejangsanensis]